MAAMAARNHDNKFSPCAARAARAISASPPGLTKAASATLALRELSTDQRVSAAAHAATDPPPGPGALAAGAEGPSPGSSLLQPDPALALRQLGLGKLATVWMVYQACGSQRLVRMAPALLRLFDRLRLSWMSNAVVRRTFFAWFCAGETEREIVHTMRRLKEAGIGSILDFSAEADLEEGAGPRDAEAARAQANVKADAFTKEYLHGLHMAAQVPGSFAALKVTGLADPEVLFRLSQPYMRLRAAFDEADGDRDGRVDFAQFRDGVLAALPGGQRVASASGVFGMVDRDNDGQVDWVDVQMALGMDNPLARPLYLRASPTSDYGAIASDLDDYERLVSRARAVVQHASDRNVRVMVDAEHTYFQPMIDHVALVMQREFNGDSGTLVFNTYQMYRHDSLQRMNDDLSRAAREGWRFAAKLVRGAYMELERERAAKLGYASPINPTLEATHAVYNQGVSQLIERIGRAQRTGQTPPCVFVATHNNHSIEQAMRQLRDLHVDTSAESVMFGQLLGMQDATSYAVAKAGLPIYKYVPYGSLTEVMPYLIRRAQENSAVGAAIKKEAAAVMAEIRRRLAGAGRGAAVEVQSNST
ncbi:proline dehydrogenase [Coemansia interrupta]|uniref:Proline dehydrogenase n=1 Tax=Coemansia interrupta TaxID=1126814 RepID=A0A9W8HNI8_9FUNG|nr:proline dehydrogenase [Coemansia interrupta]